MEKLTRLYKIMYGSMDSLFRRDDFVEVKMTGEEPRGLPPMTNNEATLANHTSETCSKVSGYSSMTELSAVDTASTSSSSDSPYRKRQMRNDAVHQHRLHQWPEEKHTSTTEAELVDSYSCHSDSYSLTYRPVQVLRNVDHNKRQHHQQQHRTGQTLNRLSPFDSQALSQSSQSLPVAVENIPTPQPVSKKGSFFDLMTKKKNKKQKPNKLQNVTPQQQPQLVAGNKQSQLPYSKSVVQLQQTNTSSREIKISSIKDLVEVLIYQLQVMERHQAQLEVQSSNLERANKVYQAKLEIATRENDLLKQKLAMLEGEVWQCFLCSRDKIQLYSSDVCVVSLVCGHLFCMDCCNLSHRTECPKCSLPFTVDRRVHI